MDCKQLQRWFRSSFHSSKTPLAGACKVWLLTNEVLACKQVGQQFISLITKHFLQATAEVLLQEAVDDLLDEAHARQEEYYKNHDVSSEDQEVRGRIWPTRVEACFELL